METKRKRLQVVKVTSSGNTDKLAVSQSFGLPAIKRHGVKYDSFIGVKPPMSVQKTVFCDLLHILQILTPVEPVVQRVIEGDKMSLVKLENVDRTFNRVLRGKDGKIVVMKRYDIAPSGNTIDPIKRKLIYAK